MSCKSFCITREDFESAIKQLPSVCDQWIVKTTMLRGDSKETLYLSRLVQAPAKLSREIDGIGEGGNVEEHDDAALDVTSVQSISYHYTIVYSESYQVPVMYFTASWQDGGQLQLEQVWDQIKLSSDINKLSTLTQIEHPLLGIPCYHIHPCNTATMMSSVLDDTVKGSGTLEWQTKYLIMWLSLVSPLVNLPFSIPLFSSCTSEH